MEPVNDDKATALVLIPARDEAATIGRVVRGCRQAGFTVWVVDDDSSDDTAESARGAGAEVISRRGPQHGKTAALNAALREIPAEIEWIFFLDGDGQHHPADLENFWQARHGADLVVGNRMPDAARMPLARRWTNRIMSRLLRGSRITDSQCGFRLVHRPWLADWLPAGHHFQFETEMALLASRRATRVVNLPIAAIYAEEKSKIMPWRDALNFIRLVMHNRVSSI